ncbi:MAG: hypothetical protein ACR5K9_01310 [Wolbachia sp.]
MSKEYDETKVKPTPSVSQEPEKTNGSKVHNILSKRKFEINFDDTKYAVKAIKTQFAKTEQRPSKLRDFLKSIPVIGRFLVRILMPEKETYKKLRPRIGHSSEANNKTSIDNKHTEEVGSELKKSKVEQVDNEKSRGQ